jgi:hypothetical protein
METCRMEFTGKLLKRGFWLYIWDIREDRSRHLYVGRTGDTSSANASSPFRRIGQHLETKLNAKGNALHKQLAAQGIDPESCTFEMLAIGPIFKEQTNMADHIPIRDKIAALERALADELTQRGYNILGTHPRKGEPDEELLGQLIPKLDIVFPSRSGRGPLPRFEPIKVKGDQPASELLLRDRGRISPSSIS